MTVLRYAARKLLLQRTQPSVVSPAIELRVLPRFIHTRPPASSPAPVSQSSGTSKILKRQEDLKNKKQELYDLLAEVEENKYYMRNGRAIIDRIRNVKLLQILSVDVTPKPVDQKWDFYRKTRKFNVLGAYVASAMVTLWLSRVFAKKQNEDPKGEKIVCEESVMENQGIAG